MDFSDFTYAEKLYLLNAYREHWGEIKKPDPAKDRIGWGNKARKKKKAVAKRRAQRKSNKQKRNRR